MMIFWQILYQYVALTPKMKVRNISSKMTLHLNSVVLKLETCIVLQTCIVLMEKDTKGMCHQS